MHLNPSIIKKVVFNNSDIESAEMSSLEVTSNQHLSTSTNDRPLTQVAAVPIVNITLYCLGSPHYTVYWSLNSADCNNRPLLLWKTRREYLDFYNFLQMILLSYYAYIC